MTERKQALTDLRDKVKAGDMDGREFLPWSSTWGVAILVPEEAYHGSLDAAKALHEAVMPGWIWDVTNDHAFVMEGHEGRQFAPDDFMDNPARAWLLAILEALIAQEADA